MSCEIYLKLSTLSFYSDVSMFGHVISYLNYLPFQVTIMRDNASVWSCVVYILIKDEYFEIKQS